ncbi:hypothetical protein Lepto7375DRAFT_5521 [Leptolyngbya sp. PCC 7375]|nr:hypothetical protein Lepto7375DRAFT_5521 [Leptolyngbya sp. PCC 7375]
MTLPRQVPPLKRPYFIQPHTVVDIVNGTPDDLFGIRMNLLHGANYNDPAPFDYRRVKQYSSMCCQRCALDATGIL